MSSYHQISFIIIKKVRKLKNWLHFRKKSLLKLKRTQMNQQEREEKVKKKSAKILNRHFAGEEMDVKRVKKVST